MNFKQAKTLYEHYPGAFIPEFRVGAKWHFSASIVENKQQGSNAEYRLVPVLPEGLPEATYDMIDRNMIYVGKGSLQSRGFGSIPLSCWFYKDDFHKTYWSNASKTNTGLQEDYHYCISAHHPEASEYYRKYREGLAGGGLAGGHARMRDKSAFDSCNPHDYNCEKAITKAQELSKIPGVKELSISFTYDGNSIQFFSENDDE